MPRIPYQYETSPRKYEPEYTTTRRTSNQKNKKEIPKKQEIKKNTKKVEKSVENKSSIKKLIPVIAIFVMLLALSYREISIMEMFNHKKDLEQQLALIEKENGQVEKTIKEVESTLDWNSIRQKATDQLGMQTKALIPLELEKTDNVEVENKYIKEEKVSILEKIVSYFINR